MSFLRMSVSSRCLLLTCRTIVVIPYEMNKLATDYLHAVSR